jgi:AcrR family transcriptional regulator
MYTEWLYMKKVSTTRTKLLTVAQSIILRKGFTAMTLDALCESTEVTKGSFFHHFKNKEELGEAVLKQFWDEVQSRQEKSSYQSISDPLEKMLSYIESTIDFYTDPILRSGCLLAIYVLELKDTNPVIYKQTVENIRLWRNTINSMIEDIAKEHEPIIDFDSLAWAEFYISTLQGALIIAQSQNDVSVIRRTLTLYKIQLSSLFVAK